MKSLLDEGSSIIKAIEAAWEKSGKPTEFTVKILEQGKPSLFWFNRQPAIVSIGFDPKKQTENVHKNNATRPQQTEKKSAPHHKHAQPQGQKKQNKTDYQQPAADERKKELQVQQKQAQPQAQKAVVSTPDVTKVHTDQIIVNVWTPEQVDDVTAWLKEIIGIFKSDATFSTTVDKKILRVFLDKYLLPEAEESKSLYISLANLFMQALKKKHKKKFQGFSIIMAIKGAHQHDNQPSSPA